MFVIVEKFYQLKRTKDIPSIQIILSFDGIPIPSHLSAQPERSAAGPSTGVDSKVQRAAAGAEAIHTPRIVKATGKVVDTAMQNSDRIQAALGSAGDLGEPLNQAVVYIEGILDVVKDFADVGIRLLH